MARALKRNSRSGSTIVESAMMIPLLMMTIFGAIEFGNVFYMRHSMTQAAREATRTLAVEGGTPAMAEAVARDMLPGGDTLAYEITMTTPPPESFGGQARVEISLPATQAAFGDFFGLFEGQSITVSSTMRSEQ